MELSKKEQTGYMEYHRVACFFSCICSKITTLCLWAAVGLNQNKSKWMDSMDESKFVQCVLCGKITMVYH